MAIIDWVKVALGNQYNSINEHNNISPSMGDWGPNVTWIEIKINV